MIKVNIFTDGSCMLNLSGTNYGGIGVNFDHPKIKNLSQSYSGKDVTNQRMELLACIKGIEKVIKYMYKDNKNNKEWSIEVYTDSMYTIKCATVWGSKWIMFNWKRPKGSKLKQICNLDLIKKLYILSKTYPVNFYHVNSHCKEPVKTSNKLDLKWYTWDGNFKADKLAGEAMAKIRIKIKSSE